MAMPQWITSALNYGRESSEDYRIEESYRGWLLYLNTITSEVYRKVFFPYSQANDPLVAEPITGSIVNRLATSFRSASFYTTADPKLQPILDEVLLELDWRRKTLDVMTRQLATGSLSVWLAVNDVGTIIPTYIPGYFGGKVFDDMGRSPVGFYQLFEVDNASSIKPIDKINNPKQQKLLIYADSTDIRKWTDGKLMYNEPHNLPFIPVTWFDSVDMDENGQYGVPYSNRFFNPLIHLNSLLTQKQKAILFLQNVWVAKSMNAPTPGEPSISLRPNEINFLPESGSLEQAIRNLNLTEESTQIDYLKQVIYKAAQVPQDDDLSSKGKIESGVALRILYAQLAEITSRLDDDFKISERDLLAKAMYMKMARRGGAPAEMPEIVIVSSSNAIPEDDDRELARDLSLLQAGIYTLDQLKEKYNGVQSESVSITSSESDRSPAIS